MLWHNRPSAGWQEWENKYTVQMDTDLPTYLEAKLFCNTFGKLCWVILQPFFYALRPVVTYPKSPTKLEVINVIVQVAFDALVYYLYGEYSA